MNKKTILTILAILILPVLAFWGISAARESAVANPTQAGMPHIYKFSSSMCLECKEVEKIFNEIMPKYADKVSYTSVIVDSRKDMNSKLIKQYNIQLVPTVVMVNSDGSVCDRFEGAATKAEYENSIGKLK